MFLPIEPYLEAIRIQLATALMPRDDENAKKVAIYAHRTLTLLMLHANTLPQLQQKTAGELSGLLDELIAELGRIDGGALLIADLTCHLRNKPDYELAEPFVQKAVSFLVANPSENGNKLLRKIAAITLEMHRSLRQAMRSQDIVQPAEGATGEPLNAARKLALQAYLRRTFPAESVLEIGAIKAIVGGASKETLFVELRHANRLPGTVVVRMEKAGGLTQSTLTDEFDLIKTMYEAGIPVPVPYAVELDKSVLGAPFIVMSRIEGRNIGDPIEVSEPSRTFAMDLARTLAKMHQIPPQQFGERLPGAGISTRERVLQDLAACEKAWRTLGRPSIALEQAYAWLREHIHLADGKRAIVHRDVGLHNMLARDGHLVALLDWETAVIGNPAQDLGYVYHTVVPMMPWDEFLAEYEKSGGVIPGVAAIDFHRLLRSVWIMYYMHLARSYLHSGMNSTMILLYASQYVYHHSEHDLHEMLNLVYERY